MNYKRLKNTNSISVVSLFEIWEPVTGCEAYYAVSNYGRIASFVQIKSGKILRLSSIDNAGYLHIQLSKPCAQMCLVSRLVAIHFIPNPENKPEVNHKDGNKKNNHSDNLEWVTKMENMRHASNMGFMRTRKGAESNFCKYGQDIADSIREAFNPSEARMKQYDKLHLEFGVSQRHIRDILANRIW